MINISEMLTQYRPVASPRPPDAGNRFGWGARMNVPKALHMVGLKGVSPPKPTNGFGEHDELPSGFQKRIVDIFWVTEH